MSVDINPSKQFPLELGGRVLVTIDYSNWLDLCRGEQLTGAAISIVAVTVTGVPAVDSLTVLPNRKKVTFVVSGGAVNDQFNVQVTVNTTLTQTRIDLVDVNVVAVS